MNLEMTRDAKAFFRNNFSGRLAEWYSQLPREERAMVIRSGHQLPGDDSFYADPHYD
ncbi:MAG: hypothetical protein GXC72_00925 [Chitinophagaceae bacterium]|nr:hypothetical protein [Chitinophagaceae bacterium]